MKTGKKRINPWYITLALALLIILLVSSAVCINMITKATDGGNVATPTGTPTTTENVSALAPLIQQPVAQLTPMKSDVVVEVTPYTTPDPYPIIHGVRINSTPSMPSSIGSRGYQNLYVKRQCGRTSG